MNIVVWNASTLSDRYLTGVGKHALHMIRGLSEVPGNQVRMLMPSAGGALHPSAASLAGISALYLPFSRRALSVLWGVIGYPPVGRWARGADWVYCPRELSVAPGCSRYALTVHDLWPLDRGNPRIKDRLKWQWLLGRAIRRADLVLAVSDFTAERLCAWFGRIEHKIRVTGNGASPAFFQAAGGAEQFEVDPRLVGNRYVVAVGGITWKKGGDRLVALAEHLQVGLPELKVVVVGPVEPLFENCRLPSNLVLVQRGLEDGALATLVRGAELCLSLSRYEGFGITLVEAMAVGTPVVASDIPAHREVAGEAALLFDASETELLARQVTELINNPAQRHEYASRGRGRASRFTWALAVERVAAALEEFS